MQQTAACDVLRWHLGRRRWLLSNRSAVALVIFAVAALCFDAFALSLGWPQPQDEWTVSARVAINVITMALLSAAFFCYISVSRRGERSSELHLNGLVLLVELFVVPVFLLSDNLLGQGMCGASKAWMAGGFCLVLVAKGGIFMIIRQKIIILESSDHCCPAHRWASALICTFVLQGLAAVLLHGWDAIFVLRGHTCEESFSATAGSNVSHLSSADKAIMLLGLGTTSVSAIGTLILGGCTLCVAARLRRRTVSRLKERQVQGEELLKVKDTLNQHIFGMCASIVTMQVGIVLAFVDGLNVLGDGQKPLEPFLVAAWGAADLLGDTAGSFLLSGIGVLLLREDPEAGNISGHIRSVLHSAVLTSRAANVFEGRVEDAACGGGACIASFPGKYLGDWSALTWACEQGDLSSACVFLPTSDPQGRFGRHGECPETPGRCWCHSLYGEEKQWGCLWFVAWKRNIELAVERKLELVVVFFPGEAGAGVVQWDHLGAVNLWDGVGLGGSQKAEVAYLRMRGFPVVEEDLLAFKRRVGAAAPSSRRPA